eukprot:scaffold40922_cov174-Isochrysis_galbana.AAC.1
MAPLTMLVPPIYLISCLSGVPFYFALSVVAFLCVSGHRLAQSDSDNVKVWARPHHASCTRACSATEPAVAALP